MQNQFFSYSFPLSDGCKNSFISALKSKQFIIAGALSDSQKHSSIFNLFKYEQQNPKKSFNQSATVNGQIFHLLSSDDGAKPLNLAVMKDSNFKIQLLHPEKIPSNEDILQTLYQQDSRINGIHLKKDINDIYFWEEDSISLLDIQKKKTTPWVKASGQITSVAVDPIHQYLTYALQGRQVHICDKKSNNQKYVIKACQKKGDKILGIDYNPNKQCYLMTCHHQSLKFWDIRRGNVPIRCYDDHHNLLTKAKYNHSHDQLIACSYDDGTVGLLRLHSVCSSPQAQVDDILVKLYDEHEDSVFEITWSSFSPWLFASTTYNASSLVLNLVPNVEKYRILL